MDADEIETKIAALRKEDGPNKCAGKIRQLAKTQKLKKKGKLLDKLQEVAYYGLSEDLKQKLENKGLLEEFALELVKEHKTTLPVLAKYLYKQKEDKQKTFVDIQEQIGEEIEVLGGLTALGISDEKKWVKNLCETAPSLLSLRLLPVSEINSLCDGASKEEMGVVSELIMVANAAKQSEFPSPPGFDDNLNKLNKAKKLINKVRRHLSETPKKENTTEISEKIICQMLCLPPHWSKQDLAPPEERLNRLEHIIQQISSVVESQEAYSSNVDLVTKVSGGLALCGVYYSEYDTPTTAGLPILLPPTSVLLLHPSQSISESYITFTRQGAATEYVKKVVSSGIGASLKASEGIIIEKLVGGHLCGDKDTSEHTSVKSANTSVSVLKFTATTKKEFRLDEMNLCPAAKELALSIAKSEKSGDNARSFMQRYGSHVPAGSHKLGGIFYSIVDAVSHTRIEISKFANTAADKLQAQISASLGFIRASGTADHETSSNKAEESQSAEESASYQFSKEVIGPQASNPETFEQLLAYNSTWAIIDRGPSASYIPVWELARKQGIGFKEAADILEQTWKEGEEIKKKNWEEHKKKTEEQRRQERMKAMEEEILNELTEIEKKFLINVDFEDKTYRLTNVKSVYSKTFHSLLIPNLAKAFAEAKAFNAKDPDYNICAISISDGDGKSCKLECFTAASDPAVEFEEIGSEKQVLYYSENRFKWNDRLPRPRTLVDKDMPYRIWGFLRSVFSKFSGQRRVGFYGPNEDEFEMILNCLQQGKAENNAPF